MILLLCDDDISTIDVIQNQLDWKELGITRVLRAYNGVTAKEIIQREKPNIILCDIGMPQCNGIEVLKYVYENKIPTEFAFMTCYESFEYARDAVCYGATNYLTKPLDLDELYEVLHGMVLSAQARQSREKQCDGGKRPTGVLINNFLRSLRDGLYGTDMKKIQEILDRRQLGIQADSKWRIVCVSADTTKAYQNGWDPALMRYSYKYLAQEAIANRLDFNYLVADAGERFDVLSIFLPAEQFTELDLLQRCQRLCHASNVHMSILPVCLISDPFPLYETAVVEGEMRKKIRKLRLAEGKTYLFRETSESADVVESFLDEEIILNVIKQRNKQDYMDAAGAAADKVTANKRNAEKMIAVLHHDLLQTFYSCLRDNNIQAHVLFRTEAMRDLNTYAERSVFDLMIFASHLFEHTVEALQTVDAASDVIGNVKSYIKEHFRENIDRNDMAAVAYITPNYLSKRFRSETGMSLREYINQLRIDEAKRLLLSTNMTISAVACEVGFENISYFSTVFRKLCDMSPVDWRNQKVARDQCAKGEQSE